MSSIAAALGLPSLNDPQSSNDPHSPKDSEENSDEPLPGLTTLTQLDEEDDDEEGEEEDQQQEAQMLLIMKQIELQKRKNDKKQQLKYEKSAAEQVTTQFKNALAKDSSASQKRYRDEADVVNRELEELSAEHVEWEARRKKFHEEKNAEFEVLLGNLMKSITNMKNIKEEGVQIGGSVAAEALKQAEQYKKYVNEQVVIMRTRLNPIMASTSPKNQAMLDQMKVMLG